MPISDLYIIQRLLQETLSDRTGLKWRESESEGFFADHNGVRVELVCVPSSTGSRLYITLARGFHKVHIGEPVNRGFFRHKYENEEQEHLARAIKDLAAAAARQCASRAKVADEMAEVIREAICRRLLFGESVESDEERMNNAIVQDV